MACAIEAKDLTSSNILGVSSTVTYVIIFVVFWTHRCAIYPLALLTSVFALNTVVTHVM